jgi:hypothetical protein
MSNSISESYSVASSCVDYVYDEYGRERIGVDQPQGGSNYPFVAPSDDIKDLIADLFLSYKDDTCGYTLPFRIKWLYGFGCQGAYVPVGHKYAYDLLIEDAEGVVVFDSREATSFHQQAWGSRLLVLQWETAEEVLRVVKFLAWSQEETPRDYPLYFEPVNSTLDDRVAEKLPLRVRSITVGDYTLRRDITLKNGYNTTLEAADTPATGSRRGSTLVLSGEPGTGLGRFPPECGETVIPIRRINNIPGNEKQNFLLDARKCYRVERPIFAVIKDSAPRQVQVVDHQLQLINDCGPCCTCDDYIAVYEAIRRLRDRYADLIARAQTVRDGYKNIRLRWQDHASCVQANGLRLIMQPVCPKRVAVAVAWCNATGECVRNVILPLQFVYEETYCPTVTADTDPEGTWDEGGSVTCGSAYRNGNALTSNQRGRREPYTVGGSWPCFWVQFDSIDPGQMGSVSFTMEFPDSVSGDIVEAVADAYSVPTGSVGAGAGVPPIPGYDCGTGPTLTSLQYRLVNCPIKSRVEILEGDDCTNCSNE